VRLEPGVAFRFPFTGPGPVVCAVVAVLAVVPWGSLLGWALSFYFMVRAISAVAGGARRMPPLPRVSELPEHLRLWGRTLLVVLVVLAPLATVFLQALLIRFDPGFEPSNALLALALLATTVTLLFLPPALARVAQGSSAVEALLYRVLLADLQHRTRWGGGFVVLLLYLGGFFVLLATGALAQLGWPGDAAARVVSYAFQMLLAFSIGLSVRPPGEDESSDLSTA